MRCRGSSGIRSRIPALSAYPAAARWRRLEFLRIARAIGPHGLAEIERIEALLVMRVIPLRRWIPVRAVRIVSLQMPPLGLLIAAVVVSRLLVCLLVIARLLAIPLAWSILAMVAVGIAIRDLRAIGGRIVGLLLAMARRLIAARLRPTGLVGLLRVLVIRLPGVTAVVAVPGRIAGSRSFATRSASGSSASFMQVGLKLKGWND